MESIEVGNKIIAVFDGWKFENRTEHPHVFPNGLWRRGNKGVAALDYHENWNLLIPVVEKIGEICKENEDAATNKDSWAIDGWKTWSEQVCRFNCNLTKIKIEYTWKTVIQFIQWYSLNKNKNV